MAPGGEEATSASKSFFDSKNKREILERHTKFGMDPLDRALRTERIKLGKQNSFSELVLPSFLQKDESEMSAEEKYVRNVRRLLDEHLHTMLDTGLAFEHAFESQKLGFKIVVAKYGERGRSFVEVDEVLGHCEIASKLREKDELIAVEGELIVEPSEKSFEKLKEKIVAAPRPLRLTFIEGENHADEHDLEDTVFRLVAESESCVKAIAAALDKAQTTPDALPDAATTAEAKVAEAKAIAAKTKAVLADAPPGNEAADAAEVTNANLDKALATAKVIRRLAAKRRSAFPALAFAGAVLALALALLYLRIF